MEWVRRLELVWIGGSDDTESSLYRSVIFLFASCEGCEMLLPVVSVPFCDYS